MIALSHASLSELTCPEGLACTCGRRHAMPMDYLRIGAGTIRYIPDALQAMGCSRPFIVCDINTKAAAWGLVQPVLESAGITPVQKTSHSFSIVRPWRSFHQRA